MGAHLNSYTSKVFRVLILLFGLLTLLHAQQRDIRFEHFSVQDGLSQRYVQSLAVDQNGFLWIAGYSGSVGQLFRFLSDTPIAPVQVGLV